MCPFGPPNKCLLTLSSLIGPLVLDLSRMALPMRRKVDMGRSSGVPVSRSIVRSARRTEDRALAGSSRVARWIRKGFRVIVSGGSVNCHRRRMVGGSSKRWRSATVASSED